ncbi:MAG: rhomboid family intramembrane serine protease [Planctomycetota bacterium]|nr:rhomboid family intramembrane serine protease [Planctomycetota bacterium]
MGIYDRDYIRQEPTQMGWSSSGFPQVVKWLIIANVVVFLLQIFSVREFEHRDFGLQPGEVNDDEWFVIQERHRHLMRPSLVESWLQLDSRKTVFGGQVWRLLTSAFCHHRQQITHIAFNMLLLWFGGRVIEPLYGSREFLSFYITAAIVSGIAFVAIGFMTNPEIPAIGASGAVMGVLMLLACHFPRERIYLFFILPVEIRWVVGAYIVYDLHPVLMELAGTPLETSTAHAAHLGGVAFGFVYWKLKLRILPLLQRLGLRGNRSRRAPKLRVYQVTTEPEVVSKVDDRLDDILRKISESGEASLSDSDREFLNRASEQLRRKRR